MYHVASQNWGRTGRSDVWQRPRWRRHDPTRPECRSLPATTIAPSSSEVNSFSREENRCFGQLFRNRQIRKCQRTSRPRRRRTRQRPRTTHRERLPGFWRRPWTLHTSSPSRPPRLAQHKGATHLSHRVSTRCQHRAQRRERRRHGYHHRPCHQHQHQLQRGGR